MKKIKFITIIGALLVFVFLSSVLHPGNASGSPAYPPPEGEQTASSTEDAVDDNAIFPDTPPMDSLSTAWADFGDCTIYGLEVWFGCPEGLVCYTDPQDYIGSVIYTVVGIPQYFNRSLVYFGYSADTKFWLGYISRSSLGNTFHIQIASIWISGQASIYAENLPVPDRQCNYLWLPEIVQ